MRRARRVITLWRGSDAPGGKGGVVGGIVVFVVLELVGGEFVEDDVVVDAGVVAAADASELDDPNLVGCG